MREPRGCWQWLHAPYARNHLGRVPHLLTSPLLTPYRICDVVEVRLPTPAQPRSVQVLQCGDCRVCQKKTHVSAVVMKLRDRGCYLVVVCERIYWVKTGGGRRKDVLSSGARMRRLVLESPCKQKQSRLLFQGQTVEYSSLSAFADYADTLAGCFKDRCMCCQQFVIGEDLFFPARQSLGWMSSRRGLTRFGQGPNSDCGSSAIPVCISVGSLGAVVSYTGGDFTNHSPQPSGRWAMQNTLIAISPQRQL
ncbi:uncharacterized protein EV422DRAFT_264754 [Fimicolochytrium jonesii]|uniref:uncharacterized protein n=1 Tax=Fimicolochytrium jonesii TaxID=1396493 RepID=UPI0022FE68ED|nr:uncharacterized protein EV422DRAFT_264754 [Fimicolochytrium jonesii]KAI8817103.1 hypothetical protein EV422DRAFT_264754 [Fimicolochytrium jonesii]